MQELQNWNACSSAPRLDSNALQMAIPMFSMFFTYTTDVPPSWIFHFCLLPLWLYSVDTCLIGMLDPKNIGIAVGIALLPSLGVDIYASASILEFPLPVLSTLVVHSIINFSYTHLFFLSNLKCVYPHSWGCQIFFRFSLWHILANSVVA